MQPMCNQKTVEIAKILSLNKLRENGAEGGVEPPRP